MRGVKVRGILAHYTAEGGCKELGIVDDQVGLTLAAARVGYNGVCICILAAWLTL